MTAGTKAIYFFSFCFYLEKELWLEIFEEAKHAILLFSPYTQLNSVSHCQKKYIYLGNIARETQNMFTIADSLDPFPSNHIAAVSEQTLNIPCLIIAKDISQIKQNFTEYCLKHTWGSIVWMQPTSVCDFGGCTRLRRAFVKKWCNELCSTWQKMMQRTSRT